jgi:hypothetical protein
MTKSIWGHPYKFCKIERNDLTRVSMSLHSGSRLGGRGVGPPFEGPNGPTAEFCDIGSMDPHPSPALLFFVWVGVPTDSHPPSAPSSLAASVEVPIDAQPSSFTTWLSAAPQAPLPSPTLTALVWVAFRATPVF